MSITVEDRSTIIKIEHNNKLMVDSFEDGSHLSIFFTGGYSSVAMNREETEALIEALRLALGAV